MDTSLLSTIFGSIVLVKIIEVTAKGVAARMRARGQRQTRLDVALRSRYVWRDHAYWLSRLLHESGGKPPPMPEDPWPARSNTETE